MFLTKPDAFIPLLVDTQHDKKLVNKQLTKMWNEALLIEKREHIRQIILGMKKEIEGKTPPLEDILDPAVNDSFEVQEVHTGNQADTGQMDAGEKQEHKNMSYSRQPHPESTPAEEGEGKCRSSEQGEQETNEGEQTANEEAEKSL